MKIDDRDASLWWPSFGPAVGSPDSRHGHGAGVKRCVRAWITNWWTHQWSGIATAASPSGMTWTLAGPVQTVGPTNGFGNFLSQQCRSLLVLTCTAKDLGELGVDIRIAVEGILPGTEWLNPAMTCCQTNSWLAMSKPCWEAEEMPSLTSSPTEPSSSARLPGTPRGSCAAGR